MQQQLKDTDTHNLKNSLPSNQLVSARLRISKPMYSNSRKLYYYGLFNPSTPFSSQTQISTLLGEGNVPTQSLKVQNSMAGLLTVVGTSLVISSLLPTAFSQPADEHLLEGH